MTDEEKEERTLKSPPFILAGILSNSLGIVFSPSFLQTKVPDFTGKSVYGIIQYVSAERVGNNWRDSVHSVTLRTVYTVNLLSTDNTASFLIDDAYATLNSMYCQNQCEALGIGIFFESTIRDLSGIESESNLSRFAFDVAIFTTKEIFIDENYYDKFSYEGIKQ